MSKLIFLLPALLGTAADLLLVRYSTPPPEHARKLMEAGSWPLAKLCSLLGWTWHAFPNPSYWLAIAVAFAFMQCAAILSFRVAPRLLRNTIRIGLTRLLAVFLVPGFIGVNFAQYLLIFQWLLLGAMCAVQGLKPLLSGVRREA